MSFKRKLKTPKPPKRSIRWVIKVWLPPTPAQREILKNLGVSIDASGQETTFLAPLSKRNADRLRAQLWVQYVVREVFSKPQQGKKLNSLKGKGI